MKIEYQKWIKIVSIECKCVHFENLQLIVNFNFKDTSA